MNEMLEKHAKTHSERIKIKEFLEWLSEKGILLCNVPNPDYVTVHWHPVSQSIDQILDEYFKINQERLEKERRELLNECRKKNSEGGG